MAAGDVTTFTPTIVGSQITFSAYMERYTGEYEFMNQKCCFILSTNSSDLPGTQDTMAGRNAFMAGTAISWDSSGYAYLTMLIGDESGRVPYGTYYLRAVHGWSIL